MTPDKPDGYHVERSFYRDFRIIYLTGIIAFFVGTIVGTWQSGSWQKWFLTTVVVVPNLVYVLIVSVVSLVILFKR